MYSKTNDRNIQISKIHHKRKEYENVKKDDNRNANKLKTLVTGSILSIVILSTMTAAIMETGSWKYNDILNLPPIKIINNVWGAPSEEKQSGSLDSYIYYKSDGNFGWEWHRNNPIKMDGLIKPIYPEAMLDSYSEFLPIQHGQKLRT